MFVSSLFFWLLLSQYTEIATIIWNGPLAGKMNNLLYNIMECAFVCVCVNHLAHRYTVTIAIITNVFLLCAYGRTMYEYIHRLCVRVCVVCADYNMDIICIHRTSIDVSIRMFASHSPRSLFAVVLDVNGLAVKPFSLSILFLLILPPHQMKKGVGNGDQEAGIFNEPNNKQTQKRKNLHAQHTTAHITMHNEYDTRRHNPFSHITKY